MTANQAKKQITADPLMGLDGLDELARPLNMSQVTGVDMSGPLELSLDLIDEDPNQPRKENNPGFSLESLKELAVTIRARGVKSPISVRENPDAPGRYLVNHGARRYRASKLAHKDTIPAFIDNDYNEVDQLIENLQRNELTAREIADFIGRELAKGKKKGEVAKEIGKSSAFVTQHVTLLDLPEPIAQAFNSGRAKDVTVINELVTAYKKSPGEVDRWLADDSQELTRGAVRLLREFLDDKLSQREPEHDFNMLDIRSRQADAVSAAVEHDAGVREKEAQEKAYPGKLKKMIVQVAHEGRPARIILNRRPTTRGYAWLAYEDGSPEVEVNLSQVQLLALLEG